LASRRTYTPSIPTVGPVNSHRTIWRAFAHSSRGDSS
jgi:hypothetical protein